MRFLWLARVPDRQANASAAADLYDDGEKSGVLCAWDSSTDHDADTVKVDASVIDPTGAATWVSLCLVPPGQRLPFDDPAVLHAMRQILALPPPDAFSTFVVHDNECAGAVTSVRDLASGRLDHDPFAMVFAARRYRVGPGLFGQSAAPTGPAAQRYGSSSPWPSERFPNVR